MMMTESLHSDEGGGEDRFHFAVPKDLSNKQHDDRGQPVDLKLAFSQMYGATNDSEVMEGEVISSLQFNHDGSFLAVGDRGGRITVYSRGYGKLFGGKGDSYTQFVNFQSHDPEFDYLKSLEIEEKITQIKWIPRACSSNYLLSCNDKTVKLWRIGEKSMSSTANLNLKGKRSITSLFLPRVVREAPQAVATLRKSYSNAHTYHINSISVNSDQETFLTSDDLRINIWNLDITNQSFVAVDLKPTNMEELQEVITAASFHPRSCHLFAYSTSKGATKLCDMRISAHCDKHSKQFIDTPEPFSRGFFSEIVSSIADIQFSHSGRYLATRDYMCVKIWDLFMDSKPVQVFYVQDFLDTKLASLYENDGIFDKFNLAWSPSDSRLVTGSYNSMFCVMERGISCSRNSMFEVSRDFANAKPTVLKPKRIFKDLYTNDAKREDIFVDSLDLEKKALYSQWHPKENTIAVASCNNLYILHEKR